MYSMQCGDLTFPLQDGLISASFDIISEIKRCCIHPELLILSRVNSRRVEDLIVL